MPNWHISVRSKLWQIKLVMICAVVLSNSQNIFCRILQCHSEVDHWSFYHIRHLWKYVVPHLPYEVISNGQKCVSWGHSDLGLWPQKSNQTHPCAQVVCPVWRHPLEVFFEIYHSQEWHSRMRLCIDPYMLCFCFFSEVEKLTMGKSEVVRRTYHSWWLLTGLVAVVAGRKRTEES